MDRIKTVEAMFRLALRWGIEKQGWRPVQFRFNLEERDGKYMMRNGCGCGVSMLAAFRGQPPPTNAPTNEFLIHQAMEKLIHSFQGMLTLGALTAFTQGWDGLSLHPYYKSDERVPFHAMGVRMFRYATELYDNKTKGLEA